jgi:ABC-type multidrug transport system ATPase subunit
LAISNTTISNISLQATTLGKRYNSEWIFRNLSYQFVAGERYAITGANGSGKSTLLQVLWGQLPPSAGALHYTRLDKQIAIDEIYNHVSIAAPYLDLIEEFTLQEQINFHFSLRKLREGISNREVASLMELTSASDKFISNFSSGMKQRVKLGLAFFTEADFIFLDEPCTNLDEQAIAWYQQQLAKLPNNNIVFIASNDKEEYKTATQLINITQFK